METPDEIWNDIFQNIKNIIRIGFRLIFIKGFWVLVGALVLFLCMIPAMQANVLSIFEAFLISIAGGLLGNFLSPPKL